MGSQKGDKKRNLSVFDAIQALESEDVRTESQRRTKSTAQAHRAKAAQSQTKIYHHLLECRILLQRAVTSATTTTTTTEMSADEEDEREESLGCNPMEEDGDTRSSIVDHCNELLGMLLQARQQMLTGEITEEDGEDNHYSELVRRASSTELQDTLQQEYDVCREDWKKVLDRRHKDLKLHAGLTAKSQFRVLDSSFWQQVDATVEYEQVRRGPNTTDGNSTKEGEGASLDDSKVYQQLLKEFVANSATAANGSLTRLKASKSNQQKKNQVDRRASKGRKIRYKEIPKLVNFTFPLSRPNLSNLDQDEYFQSLFGGVGKL